MKNRPERTDKVARSPHNDDQFLFAETPFGEKISLDTVCDWAGVRHVVTRATPLDIRIHTGTIDYVAARPGVRAYCLAAKFIPKGREKAGRYILERLAFGANEWTSREILQADHRRKKRATTAGQPKATTAA
jgi:hypothetical protein